MQENTEKSLSGWVLYKKPFSEITPEAYEINRLISVAKDENIDLNVVCPQEFELLINREDRRSIRLNSETTQLPDFILPRMGSGTTYFGLAVIRQLEKLGVTAINSSQAIEESKDKLYSHQILAGRNLPVPTTMLAKFPINPDLVESSIGFPVVVKTLSGSQGKGVFLIKAKSEFSDVMELIETIAPNTNLIFQEYMEESFSKDIRIFIIGGLPVVAMERQGKEGSFKANFSAGGSVKQIEMTPEMKWLASEASKALHLEIAGVDLLYSKHGLKVCEVNSSPGFEGIESCCNINVPKTIFEFLKIRLGNKL